MQVVVAGGGGFIGSHLSEALLADGHDVTVVDSFCSGSRANLAHLHDHDRFTLIEKDIQEPLDIATDYILHLASRASPRDYQRYPVHTLRTNSLGTLNLLDLARDQDARFLFASTSEVYGDPEVHPQPESYRGNVDTRCPRACYDEGKRFGEAAVSTFGREHGLDTRIVRIANTYGPRMRPDDGRVVSTFITQALRDAPLTVHGDGSQTRSFCYVADLVEGILAAMDSDPGTVYNLGRPEEVSIRDLAERIIALSASDSPLATGPRPPHDPERRKPDVTRAREELGWSADTPLDTGLEKTIAWFR